MNQSKKPQPKCGAIDIIEKNKKKDEKPQSPPLIHDPLLDEKEIQVSVSLSEYKDNQMTVNPVAAESTNRARVKLHPRAQWPCSGEKHERGPVEGTSKLELVRGAQHSRAPQTNKHAYEYPLSVFDKSSLNDEWDNEGWLKDSGQQQTKNPEEMDIEGLIAYLSQLLDLNKSVKEEASSRCSYLKDRINQIKLERSELKISLKEARDDKTALERNQMELKSEVSNLEFKLKQEQENHRKTTMMYHTNRDKLRRMEELHQQEVRDKRKLESTLRNLELKMRKMTSNMKQLKGDHSEGQRLLAQESSARTLLGNLLKSNIQKQEEMEKENERNKGKSNEALSKLTEASVRERELLQQIAALQEQVSMMKSDLKRSNANSSLKERHLLEENEILKKQLEDVQQTKDDCKLRNQEVTQVVFSCTNQLTALKAELAVKTTQLGCERLTCEALETQVKSTQSRLADAEKALLREKEEHQRLKERLTNERVMSCKAVSSLSQKLAKAVSDANKMEDEVNRVTLQLTEKSLLLDGLQQEKNQASARVKNLESVLQMEKDSVSCVKAHQEATQEQLAQVQSEAMLLRQQLEEAQNKEVAKETKLWQLQQELADSLKKLSMSEASLEVNTCYQNDLEREKAEILKDLERLKGKLVKSEDQYVQAEKHIHSLKGSLDKREKELANATHKLQEALSASATSAITIKQLQDAMQKLKMENARKEATAKQRSSSIAALQKYVQETARQHGHLVDWKFPKQ